MACLLSANACSPNLPRQILKPAQGNATSYPSARAEHTWLSHARLSLRRRHRPRRAPEGAQRAASHRRAVHPSDPAARPRRAGRHRHPARGTGRGRGTGSHISLALAYLGFRDFVILDDDLVDTTNLNRLVTADQADLQSPKTIVARRRMRAIDPRIKVRTLPGLTPAGVHPELNDVDLIIGCVDHDGPRHRLNQIAIDTRTPLLDNRHRC